MDIKKATQHLCFNALTTIIKCTSFLFPRLLFIGRTSNIPEKFSYFGPNLALFFKNCASTFNQHVVVCAISMNSLESKVFFSARFD